jgi:hypothetical protein
MPRTDGKSKLTCRELSAMVEIDRITEKLLVHGYATADDARLGFPADFRDKLAWSYFNDEVLQSDVPDIPVDRKRARDVIYYEWHDSRLDLSEYENILIKNRGNIPGERRHSRVMLLDDDYASNFIRTCLSLIPAEKRHDRGTFGANLFRTFTQVVTQPHQDTEEYVIIYVVGKIGTGAESYLYRADNPDELVFSATLHPGEMIIFKDDLFLHGATSLVPADGRVAQRDALVCTVDYPGTYLGEAAKVTPMPEGNTPAVL